MPCGHGESGPDTKIELRSLGLHSLSCKGGGNGSMIAIRLVAQAGGLPATPLVVHFDEAGGDIGRAVECTLMLPDPERRISRKHLQVACRNGRFLLRLISTNLLVELDGVPLAPGIECALGVGSEIRIGPFTLAVEGEAKLAPPPVQPQPQHEPDPEPMANPSMALLAQPTAKPSVFHDLLSVVHADRRAKPRPEQGAATQEVDLLVGEPTGSSVRRGRPVAGAPAQLNAAADALSAAVYAGLGIAAPPPGARSAADLELIGALLRTAVTGTLQLLAARGIAKRELGASPTLIQTRENNPLKFAANVDAALQQLLEPPLRGFIPALPAMRETFDDLRAHEVAMLAGMRAALDAVLQRFSPEALEERFAEKDKGMWDNLRPANHKARLWERYAEQHAEVVREIEENFDSIFAGAFGAAYEAQLARLARGN